MFTDFVLNGQGHGEIGQMLGQVHFEPGLLRPFLDEQRRQCVVVNAGRKNDGSPKFKKYTVEQLRSRGIDVPQVSNAMTLPKDAWIELDRAIARNPRLRLRAWADLASRNPRGGFNAMAKMTLEYQAMTDPGEAVVDMDAIADARTDRPLFNLKSIPLPITHSDFWFSEREIAVSRNSGTPLDTTMAEAGGRRIGESVERTLIGTETGLTYGTQTLGAQAHTGTSTIYGYTNFPYRVTKTNLTTPTGSNPEATVADILAMRSTMYANGYFGPFMVYHSTDWDFYLDNDYARLGGSNANLTLRQRLRGIEDIEDVKRLDYLASATNPFNMVMVQMTSDVAQAIIGMDITTVQWPSQGGMRQNFKTMAILVPLLKAPYNGIAAIIHGTTS